MKTTASITGKKGKVKLVFGVFALKNFCKRLGCEPDIRSVFSAFQGGTRMEAITEMVRTGIEQARADAGEFEPVSNYDACELIESGTDKESEKAMKALFSSILNEEYDVWYERLTKEVEKRSEEVVSEELDEKKSPESQSTGTT